jgi:hypothetical protein
MVMSSEIAIIKIFVLLFVAALLSGCWIPEEFDAKVAINADGSYTYSYSGILTFAPAFVDAKQGTLDAHGEAKVAELIPQLRQNGFRKADYLGKGRFSVSFERTIAKGQPSYFLSKEWQIFFIGYQGDGNLVVGAYRPDANTLQQLNALGAKVNGTLSVTVGRGLQVLKHNAESEPWLYGLLGNYSWTIKSPEANPFIIIRAPK